MRDRVERVRYPRAVVVKFPRGATVGPPGDSALQRQVLVDAFAHLQQADAPGAIAELEHRWHR